MNAINIDDLRNLARRRLPRVVFEFIDGGSQDEVTLHANQTDFAVWRLMPRTLTDIRQRDQSVELFGERYASPLILAPTGLAGIVARKGELQAVRAASRANVPYCLSTMATRTIEEIADEADAAKWFLVPALRAARPWPHQGIYRACPRGKLFGTGINGRYQNAGAARA
jgi:isopentenyl diphosphate isomerase/L-lactate dehydrogenase-like FMN-dependent dehydrogenase